MANMSSGLKNWLLATGSFSGAFDRGVIELYSGAPPASADEPHAGTLLGKITTDGEPFTPGQINGGLRFLIIPQLAGATKFFGDSWVATFTAAGVVGSWRLKTNVDDPNVQSFAHPRLDGVLGSEANELYLPQTTVDVGDTVPIQLVFFTFN